MKPSAFATAAIAVIGFPPFFDSVSTRFAFPEPTLAQVPVYSSLTDAQPSAAGGVDASCNSQVLRAGGVTVLAQQSDGKIVVGRFFHHVNGVARNHITRLNTDGTLDTSFNLGWGPDTYNVYALAIRSGRNIFIGGARD